MTVPAARSVSRSIIVDAPPEQVFAVLADPRQHRLIDGSGSVRGAVSGPSRLAAGSRFRMRMRIGVPYVISNTVVEYDEGRRIAWRHLGRHRWRWQLEPEGSGTRVTETFDWSTALAPALLERAKVPAQNTRSLERTLPRLKELVESRRP